MNTDVLIYLLAAAVLIILAFVAGRLLRRRPSVASEPPDWISQRPEHFERGEQYCELRVDFNYTDEKPSTSRVTATYFSLEDHRREVLSDHMTESEFSQQRAKLRRDGWQETYKSVDREGQSYYYRRSA
ncbi:MAG: hypothetical protein K8J31_14405 [Anaerolineae bacterium]|nr:hypothetical protein [Anaerolineae bacterium]